VIFCSPAICSSLSFPSYFALLGFSPINLQSSSMGDAPVVPAQLDFGSPLYLHPSENAGSHYYQLFFMELGTDPGDELFSGPYLLKVRLVSSTVKLLSRLLQILLSCSGRGVMIG